MKYADDLSILEARDLYFQRSGFSTDSYSEKWAKFPFFGTHFYLPNFKARQRAIPLHDIDHILTEYDTSWRTP